jgi:hypothetical protein
VVLVAPSQKLHRIQVKVGWVDVTGYVGPYYPIFTIFNVLGPMGIVVIYHFAWAYI